MILPIAFLDDLFFWLDIAKWLLLLWLAFYYYNWAKEHLSFSPLLTMIVAGLLIYYLVIQHPIIGALGWLSWAIISSSLLLLVPSLFRLLSFRRL